MSKNVTLDDVFKRNLLDLMEHTGMSYVDVGKASGSDPSTIRLICLGKRGASIHKADDIARAFGLNGWDMLKPDIVKNLSRVKQMNLMLQNYTESSDEGKQYIERIAEKEAEYKEK